MTPEEISKAKDMWSRCRGRTISIAKSDMMDRQSFEMHQMIPKMLEHIDSQAEEIKRLEDALEKERANVIQLTCICHKKPIIMRGDARRMAAEQLRADGVIR